MVSVSVRYLFYQKKWMKRSKHELFVFPPKQNPNNEETHCASPSRHDHKRFHEDVRDGPRPCKVPKKSLKLIIPSYQVSDGNATGTPTRSASKYGSRAVTDLRFVPQSNGSKADSLNEFLSVKSKKQTRKNRAKILRKTTSHTVTRVDMESVTRPSSEVDSDASEDI